MYGSESEKSSPGPDVHGLCEDMLEWGFTNELGDKSAEMHRIMMTYCI